MNPASRSGRGRKLWPFWQAQLDRSGICYEAIVSESIEHCTALTGDDEFDVAVAVGGDGTINAVLNGILQNRGKDCKLGVLYAGTSPDFCRFNGIPREPGEALDALLSGQHKPIDVLRMEYLDHNREPESSYLACSANIGLGKDTADGANRIRKYFGDKLGTALSLTFAIIRGKRFDCKVILNAEYMDFDAVNHLAVVKNPYIASGLKLNLDLSPGDGQFGLWVMHGMSLSGIMRLLPRFYTGTAGLEQNGIISRVGIKTLEIVAPVGLAVEFDGDHHGYLPAKISVAERQLNLLGAGYEQ